MACFADFILPALSPSSWIVVILEKLVLRYFEKSMALEIEFFWEKGTPSADLSELNTSRAMESSGGMDARIPVMSTEFKRPLRISGVPTISIESWVEAFATATDEFFVPIGSDYFVISRFSGSSFSTPKVPPWIGLEYMFEDSCGRNCPPSLAIYCSYLLSLLANIIAPWPLLWYLNFIVLILFISTALFLIISLFYLTESPSRSSNPTPIKASTWLLNHPVVLI